jgi:hypothetical protein
VFEASTMSKIRITHLAGLDRDDPGLAAARPIDEARFGGRRPCRGCMASSAMNPTRPTCASTRLPIAIASSVSAAAVGPASLPYPSAQVPPAGRESKFRPVGL